MKRLEKVFDAHIHHTFDIPLEEAIAIFKAEFQETGTVAGVFLSCPHHSDGEKLYVDELQNVKTLCLKHAFSGSYAYAALVHSECMTDTTLLRRNCGKRRWRWRTSGIKRRVLSLNFTRPRVKYVRISASGRENLSIRPIGENTYIPLWIIIGRQVLRFYLFKTNCIYEKG